MAKSTTDEHYQKHVDFPLWKLIRQRAEEKDISYIDASREVIPEYERAIRYRDNEFEDIALQNGKCYLSLYSIPLLRPRL